MKVTFKRKDGAKGPEVVKGVLRVIFRPDCYELDMEMAADTLWYDISAYEIRRIEV